MFEEIADEKIDGIKKKTKFLKELMETLMKKTLRQIFWNFWKDIMEEFLREPLKKIIKYIDHKIFAIIPDRTLCKY